ncbi:LD-carboxypeptidase LdcB/DacB [Streptococcus constellatus subsp. pharyngis]|uniref:D-alanyl-D-alanine carboxypeptidase n=2 Tax=Streptococcus constellatus subsp. pharyngis SK1060 = CCUG 46377 TaxID=1035184 RepID=U2ZIB4_STRCV|nr:LD-carboxypeptidase LdcB/DacB [Streptococcus constellatus]AGU72141.1 surface antigen [Streptococcus constellatus subsp. pharyngis C232]AGU73897.1 surface antigen [Streptococcus constellatus subsp. pharyngis C818]AGU79265.1 surface antigen [Streptococcus constellatus subsp. pharyngis C1050]QRP81204.1 SH3 domain-containing protein [Streptococcus constellatus]GAD45089.1 D-alanyl-D-alanine carboxypeptidase [Streptococcus constellatus subsp. pharyngis SK1060 = CCUG 46377]
MKKMFDHKEQRFSIRKYSCGTASVLIGCVLFMGGQAVSADEQVTTDTSIETSQVNTAAKNNIQNTTGSTAVAPQTATTQKDVVEKAPAPVRSSATMMFVEKSSVDTQETTKIVDKTASAATDTRRVQSTTVDAATQTEDETTNSSVDATTDTADSSTTAKVEKSPVEKEARKEEIDVAKLMDKTQTAQQARLAESKVAQSVPSLPSQGYYTYTKRTEVKNEPKASAALQFYVNAGDRVYYDRVLVADGYQWLSYRSYSGIRRYAAINKLVTEPVQPAKPTPSSTGTLPSRGRYTFSETAEVKNEAKWSAPTQFTFNRGDSVNYDKVLENDGYQWISYISYSGMRRYAAVTKLAQPAPQRPAQSQVTGTIHIENKTSQGFDVVVTNVSSTKGVKTVKLPIWSSQGGQDDVIWYDAIKQTDGTYKLSVDIRRHKNNRGEYNIHMYYIQSDGSLQGVTGTTTKVEGSQTSVKEVQYNGSYYFVQGKYDEIVVANKKHPMAANYNPGENPTAKAAFLRLRNDMIAQGYNVGYAYSGFRSYDYQKVLYQNYVNKDGQAAADRYSARPGYSEHQTGLVFDLTDKAGNLLEDAAASTWLKNNAHRYGSVVRYQPGKEASTGYMPEAWHIRYIGKEADEIYHSSLSLEEYYGFEGGDYVTSATTPKPSTPSSQKPVVPAQGVYRFTKRSSIKAEPRMSAPELAYYNAGQSVTYDKVLNADGVTWISYIAFSGKRRYIAIA